jgi:cytochrome P450
MIKHWFSDVRAFRHDPLNLILERGRNSQEAIIPLALGPAPVVLVRDAEVVKSLLKLSEAISDKGTLVSKLKNVIGASTLTVSGEDHRRRRAVLHERLSRGVASSYIPQMTATIRATCVELSSQKRFRADIVGGSLALKLILIALFGHKVLTSGDEMAVMDAVNCLEVDLQNEMFRFLPRTPWKKRKDMKIRGQAVKTMEIIIEKVRQKAESSSVLSALKELKMTDTEISQEITTMIIAGYHTTGAALAWLCYYLSKEHDLLTQLREEHAKCCDDFGEIIPEKLSAATISLSFVKEVLRLYPSAWWTTRELKQAHSLSGFNLKKGTTLIISPWLYQRDPKNFVDPDKFSIQRSYSAASFLPFGSGPRTCVGMGVALLELQLSVLELASSFDFRALPSELKPSAGITLGAPPIEINLSLREANLNSLEEAA